MEYMTLLGREDLTIASRRIATAVEDMKRTADSIDNTRDMFMRQFDTLIRRLEDMHREWIDQQRGK